MLLWTILAICIAVASVAYLTPQWNQRRRERTLTSARQLFHLRREWLEAKFVDLAQKSGRPRGLLWKDVEFENSESLARDRHSNQLQALVGVTIRFEAIPGGDMEHVEAVGNLRAATAVFRFDDGEWKTSGRAIFNLSPVEAIKHLSGELETVE
tara:strand:+ start:1821 stop:2282 length:462 start_codon:yes stop_codon:yes gene_type:complete